MMPPKVAKPTNKQIGPWQLINLIRDWQQYEYVSPKNTMAATTAAIKLSVNNVVPSVQIICGENMEQSAQHVESQHRPSGRLFVEVWLQTGTGRSFGHSNQESSTCSPFSEPPATPVMKPITAPTPAHALKRTMDLGVGQGRHGIGGDNGIFSEGVCILEDWRITEKGANFTTFSIKFFPIHQLFSSFSRFSSSSKNW